MTFKEYLESVNGGTNKTKSTNPYDVYMEEAKRVYNQSVAENNKNAQNQSALAYAQYNETNRNINELNKAQGVKGTGYVGNSSVDAYNAYRNQVNNINANTSTANNQLYSYYVSEMQKLEEAKTNRELLGFESAQQEEQQVLADIDTMVSDNIYDTEGNLKNKGKIDSTTAEAIWEYVTSIYGENVPKYVMANLYKIKGFKDQYK